MKKRKPPFVLATFLVIMLIAVAIVYKPTGGQGDGHDHGTPPPQEQASNQERPKITPQQSTEVMKNAMSAGGGGSAVKMDRPGNPAGEPSIKLTKGKPYKPTPSDSSISTQWYTDETRK